ncbi:flagellar biosynthetic protein FliO [Halopseudomonas maritima]|uniref:flagellar biosynthetic protein FliO n=1 Tax=Halopseudomonas maritima TaxID=2918528 RepID=UPI001EE9BF24|nr:flagellar biosynthetic protein FliO [Halopseudomonas maritima]UJJ31008.1 flagellar biosynthetic protein FliO [Halopseudomonas maritima]
MRALLALVAAVPLPLLAQTAEPAAAAASNVGSASLAAQLSQLALGLLVVVGLIFLLGWLLRRVGPMAAQGGQHIRLLSSLPLGPRDRLLLVDVGGTQMLLGTSPGRINTLHVFDQPVADLAQAAASNSDFARKLQALLKRDQTP